MFAAIKVLVLFSLLTGVVYPIVVTGLSQVLFNSKANGSVILKDHKSIGSALIAQNFSQDKYFKSRPSAADYDASSSGATNLSITSKEFKEAVEQRALLYKASDLLTASSSGLDPHISREAALEQADRVLMARGLGVDKKESLVSLINSSMEQKTFGFLGEQRVNVLLLNLKLDESL